MPNFCLSHKRMKVLSEHADRRLAAVEKTAGAGLRRRRPDPAQGPPDFAMKFETWPGRRESEMLPLGPGGCGAYRSFRMKLFTGSLAAGLVLLAGSAQA